MTDAPRHRTVDAVLAGRPATAVTRQLIKLAIDGGLRPHQTPGAKDEHGLYLVIVDYPAVDGLFGAVYVSAVNGNVNHAVLCHGNDGTDRRYGTVAEVRRVLTAWRDARRPAARRPRKKPA